MPARSSWCAPRLAACSASDRYLANCVANLLRKIGIVPPSGRVSTCFLYPIQSKKPSYGRVREGTYQLLASTDCWGGANKFVSGELCERALRAKFSETSRPPVISTIFHEYSKASVCLLPMFGAPSAPHRGGKLPQMHPLWHTRTKQ